MRASGGNGHNWLPADWIEQLTERIIADSRHRTVPGHELGIRSDSVSLIRSSSAIVFRSRTDKFLDHLRRRKIAIALAGSALPDCLT